MVEKNRKQQEKKISNRREMQEDTYVDYQIKCTSSIYETKLSNDAAGKKTKTAEERQQR